MKSLAKASTLAVVFSYSLLCRAQPPALLPNPETNSEILLNELATLDPHSETNLPTLAHIANIIAKAGDKAAKAGKKLARNSDDLKDLPTAELKKRFTDEVSKYQHRAADTIARSIFEISKAPDNASRDRRIKDILEVQASLRQASEPIVPTHLGMLTPWLFVMQSASNKIARGTTAAVNLAKPIASGGDASRTDPLPSTFWTRPAEISHQDLYAGFGRDRLPHLEDAFCVYNAPKVSSGTHAGFDVESGRQRYKIKFGEVNSEPFTARIFYALGYHVDPTDYATRIKVSYNRRMLREFHLRKPLTMQITPFGMRVCTVQLQKHFDPFQFITTAVFKDGHEMSGMELKEALFKDTQVEHPEDSPENFRPEIESALDYLVMAPANIQARDQPTQSIGSWEFSGLGHEDRRELRGAGLLAAWLAWFDSRSDNTKLRIERDADEVQLQHFISDLGGGMGQGKGWFSPHGENPNDFTWTFTEPRIVRGPGRMTTPFHIDHFKPVVPTPAFAAMTADDARWMARLIGQLTENQLREALIASGYDNAEARFYLEKLISRRDRMIRDLGLENEIPLLRPHGQNHEFSFEPLINGPFEATVNGLRVSARESTDIIVRGVLKTEVNRHPTPERDETAPSSRATRRAALSLPISSPSKFYPP